MGTKFIATLESQANDTYKRMLVDSSADDILLTRAFAGLETNMLRPSIVAAGISEHRIDAIQAGIPAGQGNRRTGTHGGLGRAEGDRG